MKGTAEADIGEGLGNKQEMAETDTTVDAETCTRITKFLWSA